METFENVLEIVLVWTAKTEPFENVNVIHITDACAKKNNGCGVLLCIYFYERFSVEGKTLRKW